MRIGIDARLWNESGVGRYTRNLIAQLTKIDKKNEYVLFVLGKDVSNIKYQVSSDKLRLVTVDVRWHTFEEQLRLPGILNKEKLDLVHFPYFSVPIFYNKPFVVTIHDLILHHFPTGEASTLPSPFYWTKLFGYKFVIALAAKRAKKIITVSHATKDEIIDHLGISSNKIVVTYEGVDNKVLSSKYKVLSIEKPYFIYVGNAYPHKNLEKLIEAFSSIKYQVSSIKLVLVGKEDFFYKRLKEEVQKIGLEKQIVFYGEATDEELTNLYKNARALIMPSLMEGFGLPALEAMSNKCLVLASNIPVHREIIGDAAFYFDLKNVEEMKTRMENVCFNDSNHFNKMIEKGFRKSKLFSWEKMAKQTLEIYESCVGV